MKNLSKIIFPLLVLIHIGARIVYSDAISGSAAVEFTFSGNDHAEVSYIPDNSFDWKASLHNEPFHSVENDVHRTGNAHLPFRQISFRTDLLKKGQALSTALYNE